MYQAEHTIMKETLLSMKRNSKHYVTSNLYAAVNCGFLSPPANGDVVHTGTTFDETAEFSCNTGYQLSDSTTRRCMANGMWSDDSPTCIRMSYSIPSR